MAGIHPQLQWLLPPLESTVYSQLCRAIPVVATGWQADNMHLLLWVIKALVLPCYSQRFTTPGW